MVVTPSACPASGKVVLIEGPFLCEDAVLWAPTPTAHARCGAGNVKSVAGVFQLKNRVDSVRQVQGFGDCRSAVWNSWSTPMTRDEKGRFRPGDGERTRLKNALYRRFSTAKSIANLGEEVAPGKDGGRYLRDVLSGTQLLTDRYFRGLAQILGCDPDTLVGIIEGKVDVLVIQPKPSGGVRAQTPRAVIHSPWVHEVEQACGGQVKIHAVLNDFPDVTRVGTYSFPSDLALKYQDNVLENDRLYAGKNESIAEFVRWSVDDWSIDYQEYEYVQWKTLREAGRRPISVYTGAILVSPDTNSIYVHHRAKTVQTLPNKFHSFAGAFRTERDREPDGTLRFACERELHEESGAQVVADKFYVAIVEDLDIGWIDVMLHGGAVSPGGATRIRGSSEGEPVRMLLTDLESHLRAKRSEWVNNGVAHHLMWLKLGAPGAPPAFVAKADEIYERLITDLI